MKIAILGGSFDPPHIGHYLIAKQVLELLHIDQVWLMPMYETTGHAKIFQKNLSPVEDRVAMAEFLKDSQIKISDFEIQNNKKSITIRTLEILTKQYPEDEFYWITGSDKLETFQQYERWQDIVHNHNLIIFPREWILAQFEEKVKETLQLQSIPPNVIVLQDKDLILTNISSTTIRGRVKKNLPIDFLVMKDVETYIEQKKLYK